MVGKTNNTRSHNEYTIGWICALPIEFAAAVGMLDEIHPDLELVRGDQNMYTLGAVDGHNVVVMCIPAGSTCITPAVTANMLRSFPSARISLMVSIDGAGAPKRRARLHEDIRLGDIVVSAPLDQILTTEAAVVPYNSNPFLAPGETRTAPRLLDDPERALRPDPGTEDDFKVEDNPFAFSPGQLNKLLKPKSLSRFWELGGLSGSALNMNNSILSGIAIADTTCPMARSFLPVVIGRKTFDALPDTNAPCNVMTEAMASALDAHIDRDPQKQRTFRNALGQHSRSSGMTTVELSFPDKKWEKWVCEFAVVRHCAESLVIGDPFLQLTSTMDKFRHRLKRVVASTAVSARKALRLMHLATPRRKMSCYVDGEHAFSNVDSGADADFASLEYALFHGWDIQTLSDDEGFVMLADRQVVKVAGYVDTDLRIRGEARQRRFYILDGLVCDVLLGDDTIDTMDVFNKYKDSFIDLDLGLDVDIDFGCTTDSDDFCVIRWADFYDETTDHVNQLLGTAPAVGSSGQSGIGKFVGRLKSGIRKGPSLSDQDVELELMRKLEAVDVMERQFQREATKLLSTLTGDELDKVKRLDSERKTKHQATRQKIIDLIQHYQH